MSLIDRLVANLGEHRHADPAADRLDLAFIERSAPLIELLARWFRPSYDGLEHIANTGGALLVGNHGLVGFDAFFLCLAVYRASGRLPRGLGEHLLFANPLTRGFWFRIGAIDGNRENAERFLGAGELLLVYPGGARDALKGPGEQYRLRWEKSQGFIRIALAAQVPLHLVMGIGLDDTYHVLGRMPLTGRIMGHEKYGLPVLWGWGPIPRPVKFHYVISEPLHLAGTAADAERPEVVGRLHGEVWARAQAMLEAALAERRSVWTG